MKVLSKATIYGLRALIYVATKSDGDRYVNIGEISTELDISFHFLTKTFQVLTQNGIFLIDLVHILERQDFFSKCLLGLPGCGSKEPCPVHNFWKEVKGSLEIEFRKTSLAFLAENIQKGKMRL